mmetsp:Transcript_9695/g.16925  ORF Transcript_9695/g.16925 Transcript_9695/m.16925 type:complete len:209 (-) Transcript_9695:199-825(-)
MRVVALYYTSAALGLTLTPTSAFVAPKPSLRVSSLAMVAKENDETLSTRSRYKTDIDALDQLLDSNEEEKLEQIRALIEDIQETRKNNPEVAIPHKVRDALAEYHRAEAKFGHDSREAQVCHEYFLDVSRSENIRPEHYESKDARVSFFLDEALEAVNVLEELKEIAHLEKSILDRFGTTDFEIGEGLLERGIGREDPDLADDYSLWP